MNLLDARPETANATHARPIAGTPGAPVTSKGRRGRTGLALACAGLLAVGAGLVAQLDDGPQVGSAWPQLPDELGSMHDVADQIGARTAWAAGATGAGVGVALVDTGVSPVAEIRDRIVATVDFSEEQASAHAAHVDSYGHGTHLAGIIAGHEPGADLLEGTGFFGIAPEADLVSLKVAGADGAVTLESVVSAIDWAVLNQDEYGIRVLVLALDTGDRSAYREHALAGALERAWDSGIVVVVGAGNDGDTARGLAVPASDPFVITVGAVDMTASGATVPDWSGRGDGVRNPDLAAPGAHIESLVAPGSDADLNHPEGRVDDAILRGSGTSQAAAVVGGSAAVLLGARPNLTPDQIKAALTTSAAPLDESPTAVGAGMVDVSAALNQPVDSAQQNHVRATVPSVPGTTSTLLPPPARAGWSWGGNTWVGNTWVGNTWVGNTWVGNTWVGNTWVGNTWVGNTWV